jgi:hypothetical protein
VNTLVNVPVPGWRLSWLAVELLNFEGRFAVRVTIYIYIYMYLLKIY